MNRLQTITDFLSTKELAIAGVSRSPKKFGGAVFKHLSENGFTVYPVNPNADKIGETKCYPDVLSLPEKIDRLFIVTSRKETKPVIEQAIKKGIKKIWIQQMSQEEEAVQLAEENGVELITRECILMFADPVKGPHKFHRFFNKLFGRYPK
ncbi:MAG: CoA-binding protein [Bacteroidales bacterium]|nr:MAG: CoA-binding protein [Bacteroidales bacterium]